MKRGIKKKSPRLGWQGRLFRKFREERGRTREWVAAMVGGSAEMVGKYERDVVFPYPRWRDAAALALKLDRRLLGVGEE